MKTSLIILTYNELEEGTIPCIESIYKHTSVNAFELIVVDNNSKDGTQKYLKELTEKHPNVKIILNKKNKGFAAGMNDGLRIAEGDFLFILNNDILVSPNWLEKLTGHLENNDEIGLIGPISNSSGNEQGICFEGLNRDNYVELINDYTNSHKDELYYTKRLAFFCVGIRRDVFEKVGILDEKFGIGWFEDDDYCLRVIKAGYQVAIAEGCFIYHHGSLSFGKGANTNAKQNELYFNKKHGVTWTLSENALAILEKVKKDINQDNDKRLPCLEKCLKHMRKEEESVRFYHNNLSFTGHLREVLRTLERNVRKKLRRQP